MAALLGGAIRWASLGDHLLIKKQKIEKEYFRIT
jgi:hypothetical protein